MGQSSTALGTATADLTDHRGDLTSTCSILRIFRIPRRGRHVHSTQCVHWCSVGVTILSQVTAVFTLASFAPAQSIDQSWRLSGSANSDQSKHAERVTHDSYIQRVLVRRERTRTLVYIKRGLGGFSSSNSKRKRNAPEWETLPPTECHNLSPGGRHRPLPLQLSRIRDLIHRKCRCPTVRHQLAAEI